MIKQNILFVTIFSACSVVHVQAMEKTEYQTKGQLIFRLGADKKIKSLSASGLVFDETKPSKETIFDVLSLSTEDSKKFNTLFDEALTNPDKIQTNFVEDNSCRRKFLATIFALKKCKDHKKYDIIVEVNEVTSSPKILRDMPDIQ